MPDNSPYPTQFEFGSTLVKILQGDIRAPGVKVDAVASTDDNYLTMGSGVARLLREWAGPYYVRAAQAQCPVRVGTVVATKAYRLPEHGLDVKHVLHGTVVDYDTDDYALEQVVYQATTNCLETAEALGLKRVLFPAFATGAGGLGMEACARHMGGAIKAYLAQERPLEAVYIMLYLPAETSQTSALVERNQRYIWGANLVLNVAYDPTLRVRQTRDFFGRGDELRGLEDIITGKGNDADSKRHAVVLGGPSIGKWALLDQIYYRAQQPDSPLGQGRRLLKVTFGRVHENTPASFIYRKFLSALEGSEADPEVERLIKRAYADPDIDGDRFLAFLQDHADRFPELVILIDNLPRLLQMEAGDPQDQGGITAFWRDLNRLQARVKLIFTARDDEHYRTLRQERLERFAPDFHARLREIRLKCVTEEERQAWVEELYRRYLYRQATSDERDFFEAEAGWHPYLISLTGHALIQALKRETLTHPNRDYDRRSLAPFFQAARNVLEEPRQAFFDRLLGAAVGAENRFELISLAKAVEIEREEGYLLPDIERGDPNAVRRFAELATKGDPRQPLHADRLQRLEEWGYLVDAADPAKARFMAESFATWMISNFGEAPARPLRAAQPTEARISLLGPEDGLIKTLFRERGGRVVTANTPLQHKDEFMRNFDSYIRHTLHPTHYPDRGDFANLDAVGAFILNRFTTSRIRGYLKDLPQDSTITLEIDDALNDIPWELMMEAIYAGEIPFRIGRNTISQQGPGGVTRPPDQDGAIKALLIGDPTDDLPQARDEVQALAQLLRADGRFSLDDEDVLIGSGDCRLLRLLNLLGSGEYGLLHFSGHSVFEGEQSAWLLKDGKINTFDLTSSLRSAPPALVFSSSCESAEGGQPRAIKYEDQTFDLPGAFLQAGVQAYIGTLWEVEDSAARHFAETFYGAFLTQGQGLGESMRRAKMASKARRDRINWLAFTLFGDPGATLADLFPLEEYTNER
jgi:O-acetyl-ADP-ribose deacetylase (regulator of RNase III)